MMREVVADAPSLAENGARPVLVSICVANAENRAKVLLKPIRDGVHERALRAARRTIVSGLLQRPSKAGAGAGGAALSARATRVLRGKPMQNVSLLVNRRQRSMRREVVGGGKGTPSSLSRERAVIERRSRRTGETATDGEAPVGRWARPGWSAPAPQGSLADRSDDLQRSGDGLGE